MTVLDLVGQLESEGARLWVESGQLRFRAPEGVMTDDRRAALRSDMPTVMEYLSQRDSQQELRPDAAARHEPFPLTEVQQAYLLGRRNVFDYGGVACHGYGEIMLPGAEPGQVAAAWRTLVGRHDMLRAVISADGTQQIRAEVPEYQIEVSDLRAASEAEASAAVDRIRAELGHRQHEIGGWPMFEVRLTWTSAGLTLHLSIDFLICDLVSTQLLFTELGELARAPGAAPPPPPRISFRDYVLAETAIRSGPAYERDRDWWAGQLDDLPPAPELPLAEADDDGPVRFQRHQLTLDSERWAALRRHAGANGVTASVAVLAAYCEVIAQWSRHPRFTVNLTLQNRQPLHPEVGALVGDFTAIGLLPVRRDEDQDVAGRAQDLQATLWETMDHRLYSGLAVARDLTRRRGPGAGLFPVVFTSGIGVGAGEEPDTPAGPGFRLAEMGYGITQTPQVWIDCQALESAAGLVVNWDIRDGVFPAGMADDAFLAFTNLLAMLADDGQAWLRRGVLGLPAGQADRREQVNGTGGPRPGGLLQDAIVAQAQREPGRPAVQAGGKTLDYGELLGRALAVAGALADAGSKPGDVVAVCLDKGWEQIVAVLGVLLAGGAYLPADTSQPPTRRDQILASAGARHVLVSELGLASWPDEVTPLPVSGLDPVAPRAPEPLADPGDLAYVIYTSGSTGTPKGVMISHQAALNTIADISSRFGVGSTDAGLGLASLGFDLSVYDIFGVLGAGGRLVLPDHDRRADPSHWAELVARHQITLWNSVPAQLHMLADYLASGAQPGSALSSLRLALLSGDWIPVTLPDRVWDLLPGVELVGLGGATEAAIWSVWHAIDEVDPAWPSIPYGIPLANQTLHVLDEALRPRPDLVTGELFIGGAGLATGYLGDPAKTAERFVTDPETGARLYRTGDLARYLPSGEVELIGRLDRQVKIRGHRVELAEIEQAIGSHPRVAAAAVVAVGDGPLDRRLAGFAEPARRDPAPEPRPPEAALAAAVAGAGEITGALAADRYTRYHQVLDELALLAIRDTLAGLGAFGPDGPDQAFGQVAERQHRLLRRWLRALAEAGLVTRDGNGAWQPSSAAGTSPPSWGDVAALADGVDPPEVAAYFESSFGQLPQLIRAEEDPLPLLFPPGQPELPAAIFAGPAEARAVNRGVAAAVAELAGKREAGGPLRVLEVGAGTGGTTSEVLAALDGTETDYLFTDLSRYFTTAAAERFGDQPGLRFAAYDLDAEPRSQGLADNSFDVIIAGDTLHASADVPVALARLARLLAPGGWLVATEPVRDSLPVLASLELLVRLDAAASDFTDLRQGQDQTFLSQPQWQEELTRAGADVVAWPVTGDPVLAAAGLQIMIAQVKTGRAALDAAGLASYLTGRLPAYMIPAELQVVDALPVTRNAKIDLATLATWVPRAATAAGAAVTQPETGLERRVAALWAEAFGAPQVGRDQSFLDLGGDSLIAAKLAGRLREDLPEAAAVFFDDLLRQILEGTTVAGLAGTLRQATGPGAQAAAPDAEAAAEASPAAQAGPTGQPGAFRLLGGQGEPGYLLLHDGQAELRELTVALTAAGIVASLALPGEAGQLTAQAQEGAAGLSEAGVTRICLIGLDRAGPRTVEVASWLADAGIEITGLAVLAPATEPGDQPEPFAGDLTLIWPAGQAGQQEQARWWGELCLGQVTVREADPADATALAGVITGAAGGGQ